ncbi:MAG: general secretion pathway protein GspB, partial [Chromatiaceae bacterium]
APPAVPSGPAQPVPPPVRSAAREDEELANRGIEEPDGAPEGMNEGDGMASRPADGIPDDLRQDIQSFKEQLKDGPGGKAAKKANNQKPLPPQERRLPREVEERLPSFLLTVHIYDAEPAKRFVMIDGRKLRQGDASRGGILVEEILPDGVALSFEGHPFFRPR